MMKWHTVMTTLTSFLFAFSLALTSAAEIYSYTDSVHCRVQRTEIAFSDWTSNEISNDELLLASRIPVSTKILYICILQDETTYDVQLPDHLIHQLDNLDDDQEVSVYFQNVMLDTANATVQAVDHTLLSVFQNTTTTTTETAIYDVGDDDDDAEDEDEEQRRLASSVGTNTILVLRVIYKGKQPTLSRQQLAGRIFGQGNLAQEVNMASQYAACSAGKLKFKPAVVNNAIHGVVDIFVEETVSGSNSVRVLENLVIQEATNQFGSLSSKFDHVMMILPDANDLKLGGSGFLAYAFIGGLRSVFHNTWGGQLSILAHEIGHNLGLQHAGAGTQTYGDMVGYMGYGAIGIDSPRNCFNPQKHWTLGWFQDRSLSLRIEDLPWGGKMMAFVDYADTGIASDEAFVLINVGRSSPRLFLQYNLAKDYNEGTRQHAEKVVIVQDEGTPQRSKGLQSWLVGAIDEFDPTFRFEDFDGTGNALVVHVCGKSSGSTDLDLLRLSIHLDDGTQQPTCDWNWSDFHCDDKPGSFYVDERRGYKDCGWLARLYDRWGENLCIPGANPVYDLCEESCGKCSDSCEDTPGVEFFVNNMQKYKDCKWLSTRASWQKRLCRIGKEALELCPESCNLCDA